MGAHEVREVDVDVNGVRLRCLTAGTSGPLALCLHGFPDAAPSWRHLLPELAAAGFRAIAPWMRGYAPSEVPTDGRYQTGMLAADAIELHRAFEGDADAVLIGHDWGAPAVYGAAVTAPDRWSKVVGMAVPPGPAMAAAMISNLAQLKRSWYMFFFQHPLADLVVGADDLAFVEMLWQDWSPGFDASAELVHVNAALRDPANLAAALGYYRATLGDGLRDPALDTIQAATAAIPPQPTLYLHGSQDGCIGAEVADAARADLDDQPPVDHVRIEIIDGLGHFLHLERPDEINRRILEFLS